MTRIWARLIRLSAPYALWMVLGVLLGFATIASGLGLMTTSAYIIAKASLQPSIADLQVAIAGVRFFGIARGLFRYLERLVTHEATFRLLASLRVWFYAALEPLAPARLTQFRSGDLLARIVSDVDTLENLYLRAIAPPLVAVLVGALAALLVGSFDLRFALLLLFFLILAGAGVPLLSRALSARTGRQLVQLRSELNGLLVDTIQGMPDLLAFGQEARQLRRLIGFSQALADRQSRMAQVDGVQDALTGLLMNMATLSVLTLGVVLVANSALDGVYLAVIIMVAISSFEAVLPLPLAFQYLESSLTAGSRLLEIVDATPAVRDPEAPVPVPSAHDLRLSELRFAYGPGKPVALDGLSFSLPQAGTLAIVGPSGAGKTTLASLLLRFWDYDAGHIWVGDQELSSFCQNEWRRQIAVVSQNTYLFNATVRQNLILARPDAGEAELVSAARGAHIHEFIESLPQGYETWIGEQGLRFSGGECQRLAIARALLKDAPILLLDEPTAHLDAVTERKVMETLASLFGGRTTLLITHRLVGLDTFDQILVLREGRIVEQGRHADLLARAGVYHRMWALQTHVLRTG